MFCFITTYCGDTLQLSIVQTHVMEPKYIHAHVYCTIPSLPPHIQLVLFAKSKFALTDFLQDNQRTFANLFINNIPGLDPDDSQTPSPIITLYTTDDLVGQLSYTADRVSSIAHFLSFSLVHTHTQRVFLSFFKYIFWHEKCENVLYVYTQYFQIKKLAVGSYGYGWADVSSKGYVPTFPHLLLEVVRIKDGLIDPAKKVYDVMTDKMITGECMFCCNCTKLQRHTQIWHTRSPLKINTSFTTHR